MKSLTFRWATKSGITFALDDVAVPPTKPAILDRYEKEAERVESQYSRGLLTDDERRQEQIEIWMKATDEVTQAMNENFGPLERDLHDVAVGCSRKHRAGPSARRYARSGGQPEGRDHPASDQVELP